MGRRLERHLDTDLIDRMEAGWTPTQRTKPLKKQREPRAAETYRGARRNEVLRGEIKGTWRGVEAKYLPPPPVRMNRSRKWGGVAPAKPYR